MPFEESGREIVNRFKENFEKLRKFMTNVDKGLADLAIFNPKGDALQRLDLSGHITGVAVGATPSRAVYAVDNKHSHVHVLALEGAAADEDADGTGDAEDAEGVEDAEGDPSEAKEEL